MSDPFQPDYPQWVRQIFEPGFKCTRCGQRLQLADLVSVGVSRPPAGNLLDKKPRGRAFADCSKCFKTFCFEVEAPQADIVEAVNEFYEHLDLFGDPAPGNQDKPRDKKPDIKKPGKAMWSIDDIIQKGGDSLPPKTPLEKQWHAAGKRHKGSLTDMPTEEEVQAFLKQLNRTSFKRSSKGFRHWMRQFGIDIDQPGPSTGGGPSDDE